MRRIKLSTSLIGRSRFAFSIPFSSAFLFAQLSLSVHNPLRSSDSYTILALIRTCRLSGWTVIVMLVESCHTLFLYG